MNIAPPAEGVPPGCRIQSFRLRHSEVDRTGTIKLRTIFDHAQEAAANHAADLGVGMAYLAERRQGWMLSRIRFSFLRPLPKLGSTIAVETYPVGFHRRLFALREFIFRDGDGREWAVGSSWWILVELERLRPLELPAALAVDLPDNSARRRFFPELEKFAPPAGEIRWRHIVPESGIDVNGHWNNAEYAALVHDFLARSRKTAGELKEIQLNFLQGALAGEELALTGALTGTEFEFGGSRDGKAVFAARGWFK